MKRFKKLLPIAVTLALVLTLLVPTAVLADTTTVTGTVAAVPTLTSVTANTGDENTAPSIVFVGTGFVAGETTVSITGTAGITPGTPSGVTATGLTCVFTIADEAESGARNVYVTVAGKISVQTVTFTVNGYITVTAPDTGMALSYLTAGQTETGEITGGVVASNWATDWQVVATDLSGVNGKSTNLGQMNTSADGTGTVLANKFQISKTTGPTGLVDSDTPGLTYGTKPTTLPFFISQVVAAAATAGDYTITISFVGSGS